MTNTTDRMDIHEDVSWKQALARHQGPSVRRSLWQLANTVVPYFALWGVMIWSLNISYWVTLGLAVVAAGFLARIFIIFHDCAHGSFMKSRRANRFLEFFTGVLTFTPYRQWRHLHALHHRNSGDLDARGSGDVWTLTVEEYVSAPRWKRVAYRTLRNPLVLFVVAPLYLFLVDYRIPSRTVGSYHRRGVHLTNGAIAGIVIFMSFTIGIKAYVLIQLPVLLLASTAGVWLFYVQHQFDGVYWERRANWNFKKAALRGSSYYRLPRVLQWFTGNIGFHHVHHLSPSIPNYSLEKAHRTIPMLQQVKALTLRSSMASLSYRLYDEGQRKLVGFHHLKAMGSRDS
jgi:omega-6 fatty acid desaturase (delta-12 desaturase)